MATELPGDEPMLDMVSALQTRRVMLFGELDDARASEVATTLLTLDASGDEHIELRLLSCRGGLDAALAVIDVLGVLGVPVHGTALGVIEGGPVGVFCATEHRHIAPHGVLRLRAPDVAVSGNALDLERSLAAFAARRTHFLEALAHQVGRTFAEVDAEWQRGTYLEAHDAVTLGYAYSVDAGAR